MGRRRLWVTLAAGLGLLGLLKWCAAPVGEPVPPFGANSLEEKLLVDWAMAVVDGDPALASEALRQARAIRIRTASLYHVVDLSNIPAKDDEWMPMEIVAPSRRTSAAENRAQHVQRRGRARTRTGHRAARPAA